MIDDLFQGKLEISFLAEGIISPAQVVGEKGKRVGDGQLDPVGENVVERVDWDGDLVENGEVFPERKSLHFVNRGAAAEVDGSFVDVENGGAGESDSHVGVGVVDLLQFPRPIGVFVNLVDEQVSAALLVERIGKLHKGVVGEIEVVGGNVERGFPVEVLLDVLQKEGGFSHTARTHKAEHSSLPIDFIMLVAHETGVRQREQLVEIFLQPIHKTFCFSV